MNYCSGVSEGLYVFPYASLPCTKYIHGYEPFSYQHNGSGFFSVAVVGFLTLYFLLSSLEPIFNCLGDF